MRLLLTNLGEQILKSMNIQDNKSAYGLTKATRSTKAETDLNITTEPCQQPNIKSINVLKKKLSLPVEMAEKYHNEEADEDDDVQELRIIKPMGNVLVTNSNGSLDKIIKKEVVKEMKAILIKQQYFTNQKLINRDDVFRTPIPKNPKLLSDINRITQKTINSDATNIITYLNGKTTLSPKFLDKITKFESDKILKLDKICQKLMKSKENENQMNSFIKQKVSLDPRHVLVEFNKSLLSVENSLERMKNSGIKSYEFNRENNYRIMHNEFVEKYWKGNRIDRMSPRAGLKVSNKSINVSAYSILNDGIIRK
jgi:hypothetical protein